MADISVSGFGKFGVISSSKPERVRQKRRAAETVLVQKVPKTRTQKVNYNQKLMGQLFPRIRRLLRGR